MHIATTAEKFSNTESV